MSVALHIYLHSSSFSPPYIFFLKSVDDVHSSFGDCTYSLAQVKVITTMAPYTFLSFFVVRSAYLFLFKKKKMEIRKRKRERKMFEGMFSLPFSLGLFSCRI